ncbi:MAG: 3-phosphoshikimate 1-carboxyvinyltransferase [Candidatus Omnitrophota bacterium]
MNTKFNLRVKKTLRIFGRIKASPSKSYTQRAIIIGSTNGKTKIFNPLYSQDTRNTISAFKELGVTIGEHKDYLTIKGFEGRPHFKDAFTFNIGENGTLLRFLSTILSLGKGEFIVDGNDTLRGRSNKTMVEALQSLGVDISGRGSNHRIPIKIKSEGILRGGKIEVDGQATSQVVSSLLTVAPFAEKDVTVTIKNKLVSRPYVDITLDILNWAGIRIKRTGYKVFKIKHGQRFSPKTELTIHGDYSSAAFLMAAGVLTESNVTITDLADDCQGDKKIIDILRRMGAKLDRNEDSVTIKGPFELKGIEIDCSDTPDLVPILTVLGCFATGTTRIYNIAHLIHKESNRITAPTGELMKLGAKISCTNNEITVQHSSLRSGRVSSCGDHRLAMALAVAGLRISGGVTITNAHCIAKSYPDFVSHMKKLHADFKVLPKR